MWPWKIQGQCHGWGQRSRSHGWPSIQLMHLVFGPTIPKIWPIVFDLDKENIRNFEKVSNRITPKSNQVISMTRGDIAGVTKWKDVCYTKIKKRLFAHTGLDLIRRCTTVLLTRLPHKLYCSEQRDNSHWYILSNKSYSTGVHILKAYIYVYVCTLQEINILEVQGKVCGQNCTFHNFDNSSVVIWGKSLKNVVTLK